MKIIGIVSNEMTVDEGIFLGSKRTYINTDYIDMVLKAGAAPIMIPLATEEAVLKQIINNVDGIIITGGSDINPLRYNEGPLPLLGEVNDSRDEADIKILEMALKERKGILGICRGCQIINVYFGGTLFQDISYCNNKNIFKHIQSNFRGNPSHGISIDENSFLYKVLGSRALVNSFHHQSIKDIGNNLRVTAVADDGVVEGIEGLTDELVIGVQWHPEMMKEIESMILLLKMFIEKL